MSKKSFKALVHDLVEAAEEKGKLEFICESGLDEDDPEKYRRELKKARKGLKAAKAEALSLFPRSRNFAIAMNDEGYQDTPHGDLLGDSLRGNRQLLSGQGGCRVVSGQELCYGADEGARARRRSLRR